MKDLKCGARLQDIADKHNISIDQAKRLSRYSRILAAAQNNLPLYAIDKITKIGLKILYLSSLFKEKDCESLAEILGTIDTNTKRDDLPLLIEATREKQKRIKDFQSEINSKLNILHRRELDLQRLEENMKETTSKIQKEVAFLNKYPEKVQRFLIKHLGIYNDKLVLARRLDSLSQRSMKKKKILVFEDYVWYVQSLDELVQEYLKRVNRKKPLGTEWNYEKEEYRTRNSDYYALSNPDYRLPIGLAVDLRSSLEAVENEMAAIEKERESIRKEMGALKRSSPKSFMESVEAKNTLSELELRLHGELQNKALKWLYNKGYIVASEVTLPNGKRVDVMGYNEKGHIIIVEVKVSKNDFRQDSKWSSYLEYSDEFYFLPSMDARQVYYQKKEFKGIGLLEETKNNLKVVEVHSLKHKAKNRKQLYFLMNKVLARKYVYGF